MLKDELSRLNRLIQSEKRFEALYDVIIRTDPDKTAALWLDAEGNEHRKSFREFDEDIRAAAALIRGRIGEQNEGRFVALMMENRYHWPVAFWGLLARKRPPGRRYRCDDATIKSPARPLGS